MPWTLQTILLADIDKNPILTPGSCVKAIRLETNFEFMRFHFRMWNLN